MKTPQNYATVISILNKRSQINAKIKSNHFIGGTEKNTGFVGIGPGPTMNKTMLWVCNLPENIMLFCLKGQRNNCFLYT
jgi:hypothetical protein